MHPVMTLFQNFFDPVDPLSHARAVRIEPIASVPPKHVFMTYGLGDSYSPEITMQAYAQEGGFFLVTPRITDSWPTTEQPPPFVGDPKTVGMRQYNPLDYDGHFVSTRNDIARADVTRFLLMGLHGMMPQIGK